MSFLRVTWRALVLTALIGSLIAVSMATARAHNQTYTTSAVLEITAESGQIRVYQAVLTASPADGSQASCQSQRVVNLQNDAAGPPVSFVMIATMLETSTPGRYSTVPTANPPGPERAFAPAVSKPHGTYPNLFTHDCGAATSNTV